MRFMLPALFCVFLSTAAMAQDYKTILDLPEGAALVSLSASERVEIEQDMLIATLRYEADNADPSALQDEINKAMQKAVEAAKKVSSVKVSTQQYYVYEYDPNQGKPLAASQKMWRGQQGLMIKGKKADDVLKLVADLQTMKLKMEGLTYTVSPELLEETRESLLENALVKLKAKADRTAKALGKSSSELKQINVDIGGYYPQPYMARGGAVMDAMAMKAEVAAPVAAPGESEITLTVNAQALLK